jgi:predicted NAD/FAD-dependent oxidoreductase
MIAIVGTGIAALGATFALEKRAYTADEFRLIDKSNGIGGRVASRWIGDESEPNETSKRFDHGTQAFRLAGKFGDFFYDKNLATLLKPLPKPIITFDENGDLDFTHLTLGEDRFYLESGNNYFIKVAMRKFRKELGFTVRSIDYKNETFFLSDGTRTLEASRLILTAPAKQSADLLSTLPTACDAALPSLIQELRGISYSKAIILLCIIDKAAFAKMPFDKNFYGVEATDNTDVEWLGRESLKRPEAFVNEEAFVVRMSELFTERFADATDDIIIAEIKTRLEKIFKSDVAFKYAGVKKWKYAFCRNPSATLTKLSLPLQMGGDFVLGSKLDLAFQAGYDAGNNI